MNARVVKKVGEKQTPFDEKETPLGEKVTKVGEKVNFVGEKKNRRRSLSGPGLRSRRRSTLPSAVTASGDGSRTGRETLK